MQEKDNMKRKIIGMIMMMALLFVNLFTHYFVETNMELNYISTIMAAFAAGLYFMDGMKDG